MARQVLILLCLIHHVLCQQCLDSERLYGSNLALGKETVQSSTYSEMNFNYSSNLAVDGDTSTVWSEKSCSHTGVNGPRPAWWSVDIEEERILRKIVIFNREDLTERLIGASVIGYASNGTQFEIKGSLPGSAKIELDVKTLNPIRNVTIVLPINSRENIINICEVQLFENLNIARGKSTYQSSDYSDGSKRFDASLAVDGNESSEFSDGSCTATNNSDGSYTPTLQNVSWSVNLGREYLISYIKIFNREDAELNHFSRRLGHFTIMGTNRINRSILLYHEERDDPGKEISIPLYTNITVPVSIISVSIPRVQGGNNVLTICEFEAYRAIECPIYRLENGNIRVQKYGDNERNYTLCATLALNCSQGYKLYQAGLQSITTMCQINRTWTTIVQCEDINECSAGDDVCNNNGNCTNNPGSFKCECHEGYNGKTCNEVTRCTEIVPPQYGVIVVEAGAAGRWSFNTTVAVICNTGYSLSGEALVKCFETGRWTSALGYCLALHEMDKDQEQSKTRYLSWIILGPLCFIFLISTIVTCIQLRRHSWFKRQKCSMWAFCQTFCIQRQHVPDDVTIAGKAVVTGHRLQAKKGISAYDFVEEFDMKNVKKNSNGSDNNAMELYDNLQKDNSTKSDYDKLKFERESSEKTTMKNEAYQNVGPQD